jgi:hypothetical protein
MTNRGIFARIRARRARNAAINESLARADQANPGRLDVLDRARVVAEHQVEVQWEPWCAVCGGPVVINDLGVASHAA